ncbi:hypothetical protein EIP86_004971 [Pleurotus ostreatoroseus]|nr:hypothetical protein EIP86_004971 [Pleurotus ostreatoroseus]
MAAVLQLPPPDLGDLSLGPVQDSFARRLSALADAADLQDPRSAPQPSSSKHMSLDPLTNAAPTERSADQTDGARAQSWIESASLAGRYPALSAAFSGADRLVEEPDELQTQQGAREGEQAHEQRADPARQADGPRPGGVYASLQLHDGDQDRARRLPAVLDSPRAPAAALRLSLDAARILHPPAPDMGQRASGVDQFREKQPQMNPPSPRQRPLPTAGTAALPGPSSPSIPNMLPLAAGPSYSSIPISPKPRAYAQQPTYITPTAAAPRPINPVYSPQQPLKEEVCVECAMRDQDMADVDVTGPGVWERESDALYEDLLRREEEEEAGGLPPPETASRPKARGDKLTEEHLKYWLSVNPKEPSSRQQTLDQYVKSQRQLLEAEALAHARAMRESQQLDNKMRDAYSQLRRSAYELGSSAQPSDDTGGVRIKSPRSPSVPAALYNRDREREVTLLENGMIVEHVDVRKEEREEREKRRKEERRERSRARKSSQSQRAMDAMSVYSLQTPLHTDSGFFSGVKSDSRYSQSIATSARPASVMTGGERPHTLLRAQSQASFSDMQSIGSASPRRSRFFGLKNLSSGWRSQDSLAPSGSMIDMHVALQREQQYFQSMPHPDAVDIGSNTPTVRPGEAWQTEPAQVQPQEAAQPAKKPKGFKKIWKLVTGSAHHKGDTHSNGRVASRSLERAEDDLPLAPPPPLSYLVNREQGAAGRRHVSTPSLPSSISPNTLSPYAPSPPTAPSSLVPSPTSSRRSTADNQPGSDGRKISDAAPPGDLDDAGAPQDASYPDSDSRGRTTQSSRTLSSSAGPLTPPLQPASPLFVSAPILRRDKSLPPLPGEALEFPHQHVAPPAPVPEGRPQTVFTYDPRGLVDGLAPPQAPFRTPEARRQSFGGIGAKAPFFAAHTVPARGSYGRTAAVPSFLAEERYGDFGAEGVVLGQWPAAQDGAPALRNGGGGGSERVKKRKSRFGLGALFGKKAQAHDESGASASASAGGYGAGAAANDSGDLSTFRASRSETPFDGAGAGQSSGHASSSPMSGSVHVPPRMSGASRKNLEELVEQDPEFIAYRYPSSDQRLDLLR